MKTIFNKISDKRKSRFLKTLLAVSAFTIFSCDSFLEVELPNSQLTTTAVFESYNTADAAMADVYSKMRDSGLTTGTLFGLSMQIGHYSDELVFYGAATSPTANFYTNSVLPSNSTVGLFWNNAYNQIYAANSVYQGVEKSLFTQTQKGVLQGEALFVRAMTHFYLLQLFGEIPYIKSTDYKENSTARRTPDKQIYLNIVQDLKRAEELLSVSYSSAERTRPNSFAVKALLARVYLYMGEWENAQKTALAVIENKSLYILENNLGNVFLKNSSETILQFSPSGTGRNTDEGSVFIFTSGPPPITSLSNSLMQSFSTDDKRRALWTGSVTNPQGTWYYPFKYKEAKVTSPSREYSILLRLTEQYLIVSEADARLGSLDQAKLYLNAIRNRAGLGNTSAGNTEEIIDAVLEERRKEFFTEYGHRFFDLKRTGKLNEVLGAKPGWKSENRLLPIPESEINLNTNLQPQNPGY